MSAIRSTAFGLAAIALIALSGAAAAQTSTTPDTALSENAYDFNKPDSIPGFGTLPPDYDSKAVRPLTSDGQ